MCLCWRAAVHAIYYSFHHKWDRATLRQTLAVMGKLWVKVVDEGNPKLEHSNPTQTIFEERSFCLINFFVDASVVSLRVPFFPLHLSAVAFVYKDRPAFFSVEVYLPVFVSGWSSCFHSVLVFLCAQVTAMHCHQLARLSVLLYFCCIRSTQDDRKVVRNHRKTNLSLLQRRESF